MRCTGRAFVIAACLSLSACKERSHVAAGRAGVTTTADASAISLRSRAGGTDVTFIVVSDTHFGFGYPAQLSELSQDPWRDPVGLEGANRLLVSRLNAIAGRDYPASLGGKVAPAAGLLVTGDLTEWGRKEEWDRFERYFGRAGEGELHLPVFEVVGNHDKIHGPWVEGQVTRRHGGRFYGWDWGDVHLMALGEAPDDEGLAWVARDLKTLDPEVPLVLFLHRPLDGPWSRDNWFGDGTYRSRLGDLLLGRTVLAIFHGHHHERGHYLWHSINVYKPGAVKDGAHTFVVAHVTDTEMTIAYFDYDADAWGEVYRQPVPAMGARPIGSPEPR